MSVDNERRSGGQRVPIKTLVEIGAGAGGSTAFEAESVNLTTAGMHLKTAYLPEIGEPLLCRFEGNGKEIVVQGEVVWRNEDSYGGDFGVRFLEVDPESLEALREVLGEQPEAEQASADSPESEAPKAGRNTRVRLHIEGLGAPMKARVREVTRSEVLVGSNLEFLKIGRSVDLENLDCPENRPARIERVSIEIEPSSHVPQLMVALRYLDAAEELADENHAESASSCRMSRQEDDMDEPGEGRASADDALDEDMGDEAKPQGRSAVLWSRVKEVGPKLAVLGVKAKDLGGRAKDVVARAIDRARAKRGADAEEPRARRTTSPAPNGGLRGDGRRLTREVLEDGLDEAPARKKIGKRAAAIGVAVLMIAIVAIAFTRKPSKAPDAVAEGAASAEAATAEGLPVGEDPNAAAAAAMPNAGGGLVANVPLFGPTPMATGLPVAPNAALAAAPVPAAAAVPPPSDAKPAAAGEEAEGEDSEDEGSGAVAANAAAPEEESEADDEADSKAPAARKPAARASRPAAKKPSAGSFGRGKVRNPTVLALRMNHDIKSLRGTGNANGFTVEVAGTRSKEAAAGLARQDRRIASAKVTNKGSSADLVVHFREPVPGYRVVAQGSTLRILIGNDKKTANSTKPADRSKSGTAASKKKPAAKH